MIAAEAERRTLLSLDERTDMLAYMRMLSRGRIHEFGRVMIDFSGHDRDRTVMLRLNDGEQELVAKSGGLAAAVRQEATPQVRGSTLEETLAFLAILGHTEAHISRRRLHEVEANDFTYSLRDVLSRETGQPVDTLFELEMKGVDDGMEDKAVDILDEELAVLGLLPVEDDAWREWVVRTHDQVDGAFAYSPQAAADLAGSLAAAGLYHPPAS